MLKKCQGRAYVNLGNAYQSLGEYRRAIEMHEKHLAIALETGDRGGEGAAYGNLGNAYQSLGEYRRAIEMHEKYLAIALETGDREGEGNALHNLAVGFEKLGEWSQGVEAAWAGLVVMQEVERSLGHGQDAFRMSLFEKQGSTYRLLQRLLFAINQHELALGVAGMAKARGLAHLLDGEQMYSEKSEQGAMACAEREWGRVSEMVKAQGCTVMEYSFLGEGQGLAVWVVSGEGQLLCAKILETGGPGRDLQELLSKVEATMEVAGRGGLEWQDVQGVVKEEEETAVLEWLKALGEDEALGSWSAEAAEELHKRVRSWRGLVQWGLEWKRNAENERGPKSVEVEKAVVERVMEMPDLVLKQLFSLLVAPVAAALQGTEELLVIPHHALFRVPWAALRGDDGVHLLQRHVVRVAPSLRVAATARTLRAGCSRGSHAVVVGNPWPISAPLPELGGAEGEAALVSGILQDYFPKVQVLVREQATVAAVTGSMQGAGWVHVACHGEVRRARASDGSEVGHYLLLAKEGSSDGELSKEEVGKVQLAPGASVVLSCCQSGLGQMTGEGVVGLSRALFAAGAGELVVSVCSIPDAATSRLMQRLYTSHFNSGQSLGAAMRAAVLAEARLSTASAPPPEGLAPSTERGLRSRSQWLNWGVWGAFLVVG